MTQSNMQALLASYQQQKELFDRAYKSLSDEEKVLANLGETKRKIEVESNAGHTAGDWGLALLRNGGVESAETDGAALSAAQVMVKLQKIQELIESQSLTVLDLRIQTASQARQTKEAYFKLSSVIAESLLLSLKSDLRALVGERLSVVIGLYSLAGLNTSDAERTLSDEFSKLLRADSRGVVRELLSDTDGTLFSDPALALFPGVLPSSIHHSLNNSPSPIQESKARSDMDYKKRLAAGIETFRK